MRHQVGRKNIARREIIAGLHILGAIYTQEIQKLKSLMSAKKFISGTIKEFGLHELGAFYHQFPHDGGFTGVISLVESHIAIHTWPELKYFTLDVYLCNYSKDNTVIAKEIFVKITKFYKPFKVMKKLIKR